MTAAARRPRDVHDDPDLPPWHCSQSQAMLLTVQSDHFDHCKVCGRAALHNHSRESDGVCLFVSKVRYMLLLLATQRTAPPHHLHAARRDFFIATPVTISLSTG